METNIQNSYQDLLEAGLSIIPIKDKIPTVSWKEFQNRIPKAGELSYNGSIGLVCGKVSGGIETIDVDTKNDNSGKLLDNLTQAIKDFDVEYNYVVQKTPSGGLHLIYKCESIEGNQVLARSKERKALIETRSEGGYIAIAPTPGYELKQGSFTDIPFIDNDDRERLFSACRSLNEYYESVVIPKYNKTLSGVSPWEDYNQREDVPFLLRKHGWTYLKTIGENQHFCRPDKKGTTSGTWNGETFYCFTSSTTLEPSKAYSPTALFTFLECNGDFSEAAKKLRGLGFGESSKEKNETKNFREYIIREEPKEEAGILSINTVNILSEGNVLGVTGPMKGRKTMLASVLVNQSKLRTAYIDTEQGRKHSWRTGNFTPTADVFHLRGEDKEEIKRVTNECINSGEYKLIVLDNVRDMLGDFNNVQESGEIELYLKKISEKIPVIAIIHENKNSPKGQGHVGHGLAKIAQTTIRVQLVDIEDPAKGSFVECVHTRDEPFKRAFLSMEGILSSDDLFKVGGKAMTQKNFFHLLGKGEFTRDELNERIADIFGIKASSAKNALTQIRRSCPDAIAERKEGKRKVYYVSSIPE